MSRSYKKHPVCKEFSIRLRRFHKRQANKKLRQTKEVVAVSGKRFKKSYHNHHICNSHSYVPFLAREQSWNSSSRSRFSSYDKMKRHWERCFRRK